MSNYNGPMGIFEDYDTCPKCGEDIVDCPCTLARKEREEEKRAFLEEQAYLRKRGQIK